MFYTMPAPDPAGRAYDLPFVPRYSVPEGFQRALSYEGQLHWLAGLSQDAYSYLESATTSHVVDAREEYDADAMDAMPGTDVKLTVYAPGADGHDALPGSVKTDDVIMARVTCTTDQTRALVIGTLVSACRCNQTAGEEWVVHARYVVRDYEARLKALEASSSDHEARIKSLEGRMTSAETRLTTVEGRVDSTETRITSLETRATSAESRLTTLEGNVKTLQNSVNTLQTDVTNLNSNVTNLQASVKSLQDSLTTLQQTVNNLSSSSAKASDVTKINKTLADIVAKVVGGGTVDSSTGAVTWKTAGSIAVGNVNVFSQTADPSTSATSYIRTRAGVSDNDMWFKG